ncbi:MAG: hypothetical protein WA624_06450 [Methylocella sp.]
MQKSYEAWTWGARPSELQIALERNSLSLIADLSAAEYRPLVMGDKARGQRGYEFYRVACAEARRSETHA